MPGEDAGTQQEVVVVVTLAHQDLLSCIKLQLIGLEEDWKVTKLLVYREETRCHTGTSTHSTDTDQC